MVRIFNILTLLAVVYFAISFIFGSFFIGFFNSKLENFVMCGSVAYKLGYSSAENRTYQKLADYVESEKISITSGSIMQLREYVDNEILELYKLNIRGKEQKLNDVYNSRVCQKIYD